jgi:hypothetical protein
LLGGFSSGTLHASPTADKDLSIVKILDHRGEIKFEIVDSEILPFLKKEIENEYKTAKKDWVASRNAWKAKFGKEIKFACPEPVRPNFKVVAKKLSSRSTAKIELEALKSKGPFCVVQIVSGKNKSQPEVVQKDEITTKKFVLQMEYHIAVQEYMEEKSAFEKENPSSEFTKSLPVRSALKVLKSGVKTLEKANAYMSKYMK